MSGGKSQFNRLIAVTEDGGGAVQRELLLEMAKAFRAGAEQFTPSQLEHFDSALTEAAENAELAERCEIAELLADAAAAPHGLIFLLARDEIEVAKPILERSSVLTADDLATIARRGGQHHRKAIARRERPPRAACAELIERGGANTLLALIANRSADIGDAGMARLAVRAQIITALHAPLLDRDDLTAALLTRLYFLAASPIKKRILERADAIESTQVASVVESNRQALASAPKSHEVNDDRNEDARVKAVREEIARGAISESRLIELIERDQIEAFKLAFCYCAGVSAKAGEEILSDHTWESLAIASRAAGLERSTFARIASYLMQGGSEHNKAVRMLDVYLRIPQDAAERMLRFWRVHASAAPRSCESDDRAARTPDDDAPQRAARCGADFT